VLLGGSRPALRRPGHFRIRSASGSQAWWQTRRRDVLTQQATADNEVRQLIPTIDSGIDVVDPIDAFRNDLLAAGFVDIRVESIGNHVWRGLDAWIEQTEFRDSWGRNWLTAYQRGLIDYYLITADKQILYSAGQ
jgi:hypothetical protein